MKKLTTLVIVIFLTANFANSQETEKEKEEKKATLAVKIIHNSVAGFYPVFFGNFETNKKYDITMYSVFWTNGAFGNLESGSDLLLEVGAGLGFKLLDNKLYLNPTLGFASGKFLSNSDGTKIGEGIIPSVYFNYQDRLLDFEGYLSFYKSFRDSDTINTKDVLLNWMAPGVKISKRLVLGAFYESLGITREENASNKLLYQWLGGSIKLKFDKGIAFRFSAGATLNTDIGTSDEFYKVSAFIPF